MKNIYIICGKTDMRKGYGLLTNDKNLSNWVIRAAEDWLQTLYDLMKQSVLYVDETYAQIIKRSDGKSGKSKAYNWVCRSVYGSNI